MFAPILFNIFTLVSVSVNAAPKDSPPVNASASPAVSLGNTQIVGTFFNGLQQDFFGGIPYAEAPVGSLRLQAPVMKTVFENDPFDASTFGKPCLQLNMSLDAMSEDCLSINIWRPSNVSANASLPVMFWTHGSGFKEGGSFLFNASTIVNQSVSRGTPIIFASINYRLGPLGWPQGQEMKQKGLLNLGSMDQKLALQWVQQNIGAFGGDKDKVTAMGASAGSIMTSTLFMNESVTGLVRAGIFQSGFPATAPIFDATIRQLTWNAFVNGTTVCSSVSLTNDSLPCLQDASTEDILNGLINAMNHADKSNPFAPVLDGPTGFFPDLPSNILADGPVVKLPFITGQNLDEGTHFIPPNGNYTDTIITAVLDETFAPPVLGTGVVNELNTLYPQYPSLGCPFGTGNETFGLSPGFKKAAALATDLEFSSLRRSWIQTAANASVKTYGYYFTERPSWLPAYEGVSHGVEGAFTFGLLEEQGDTDPAALALSNQMIHYFVSFVTTLNPNDGLGVERPAWPQYTAENQVLLQLEGNNVTSIPDDFRAEQISYINSQPIAFHH